MLCAGNLDIDSKSFTIKISITIKFFIFGTILEAEFVSCLNIGKALKIGDQFKAVHGDSTSTRKSVKTARSEF